MTIEIINFPPNKFLPDELVGILNEIIWEEMGNITLIYKGSEYVFTPFGKFERVHGNSLEESLLNRSLEIAEKYAAWRRFPDKIKKVRMVFWASTTEVRRTFVKEED